MIKVGLLVITLLALGHFSQVAVAQCSNTDFATSPSGICSDWSTAVLDYSIPSGCNALFRSLQCSMSAGLSGLASWNAQSIQALCISCSPFTRYVYNALEDSTSEGCMFIRESLNSLCSLKTEDLATFTSCGTELFTTGLVAYASGVDSFIDATCSDVSCCHAGELKALDYFFDIDDTTDAELGIAVALPDVELTPADVCTYVLNGTAEVEYQNDYCITTFLQSAVLEAYPYQIVPGSDVTTCLDSSSLSPGSDIEDTPTCPSWDDIVDWAYIKKNVPDTCLDLIYRARCNMDSLAARLDGFYLLSELDTMCTGECAPFTKYIIDRLETYVVEDEPGCTFVKKFIDGLCTTHTYLGSTEALCYTRGSAFLTAMAVAAEDATLGQRAFFSVCAAYSCCEDYAFTTLPSYFEISESLIELGIGAKLPMAYAAGDITSASICAEYNLTAYTNPLGDTCTSTLSNIEAWDPDMGFVSTLSFSVIIGVIAMLAFL